MIEGVPGARLAARVYGAAVGLRNRLFDEGRRPIRRLPIPVVSVGNLAVGGTGKTPVTEEIARLLSGEGWLVGILSRGYGGLRGQDPMIVSTHWRIERPPSEAGDEPFLLARRLPGVPVVVGRDRYRAGQHALAHLPVNLAVLDDGFQHRALHRDVDVVLLDATDPWAGGGLLPAGRLREPRESLKRAHVVIVTNARQAGIERLRALGAELTELLPGVPLFQAETQVLGLAPVPRGSRLTVRSLAGHRVFAFAGVARPRAFFTGLESAGATLVGRRAFRDHHAYRRREVLEIQRQAADLGATLVVTTEKDAVRLPVPPHASPPFAAVRSRVVIHREDRLLATLLSKLPGPSRGGRSLG